MIFATSLSVFALAMGAFQGVAALPVTDYPEIIPGPGMPSLTSLNLTSADLHKRIPVSNSILTKRVNSCGLEFGDSSTIQGWAGDGWACYNYLSNIPLVNCQIGAGIGTRQEWCRIGSIKVEGINNSQDGAPQSSYWYVFLYTLVQNIEN